MSTKLSLIVDGLIDDVFLDQILTEPDASNLLNLNFALRVVLTYLVPCYDKDEPITRASDILAKIIRTLES